MSKVVEEALEATKDQRKNKLLENLAANDQVTGK